MGKEASSMLTPAVMAGDNKSSVVVKVGVDVETKTKDTTEVSRQIQDGKVVAETVRHTREEETHVHVQAEVSVSRPAELAQTIIGSAVCFYQVAKALTPPGPIESIVSNVAKLVI